MAGVQKVHGINLDRTDVAILRFLRSAKEPASVADVVDHVLDSSGLSKNEVERKINGLAAKGLFNLMESAPLRYELTGNDKGSAALKDAAKDALRQQP